MGQRETTGPDPSGRSDPEEGTVNIGEPRRVIEIEPVSVPVPEEIPVPVPDPDPTEPAREPAGEARGSG
jgi:hypothetical protein